MSLTVDDVKQAKRRDDLVPGYTDWIRQYATNGGCPDTIAVNLAIMERWSMYALVYIKRKAWNNVYRPQRRAASQTGAKP